MREPARRYDEKTSVVPGSGDGHASSEPERSAENVGELRSRTIAVAIKPQMRLLHDPAVTFEEYVFYAERTRAEEDAGVVNNKARVSLKSIFIPSASNKANSGPGAGGSGSVAAELNLSDPAVRAIITDEEWTNASRALRTATAAACFYLITTDILGPFVSSLAIKHGTKLGFRPV